jgi:stage II sporulation protein AA (anti-sigma F factor antagonist)
MIQQRTIDEHTTVINPGRKLDNSNAHEITEVINKAQTDGNRYIILDMSELEFLSSAGVGAILGTVGAARDMGGDIILCGLSQRIRHILEILDLCDYLTIRQSEDEARSYCSVEG